MFVLALLSGNLASGVVCNENSVKSKIQVTRVSEVTTSDKDNPTLITYQKASVDDDHHTFELIGSGFNSDMDFFFTANAISRVVYRQLANIARNQNQ